MAENINFIPATELPEAVGDDVSVLCLENGEMKQKPANGFGSGGETPDMVITVGSTSNNGIQNGNYEITEGSVDAVFAAFRDGRYPIVKVRYSYGEIGTYQFTREEYYAKVCVYGESLFFSYITVDPYYRGNLYLHFCHMSSNGTVSHINSKMATLVSV